MDFVTWVIGYFMVIAGAAVIVSNGEWAAGLFLVVIGYALIKVFSYQKIGHRA